MQKIDSEFPFAFRSYKLPPSPFDMLSQQKPEDSIERETRTSRSSSRTILNPPQTSLSEEHFEKIKEKITNHLSAQILESRKSVQETIQIHSSEIRRSLAAKMEIECGALKRDLEEEIKRLIQINRYIAQEQQGAYEEKTNRILERIDLLETNQRKYFYQMSYHLSAMTKKQSEQIKTLEQKIDLLQAELTSLWNEIQRGPF